MWKKRKVANAQNVFALPCGWKALIIFSDDAAIDDIKGSSETAQVDKAHDKLLRF